MSRESGEEALRARRAVGLADLPDAVLLRVTGADRIDFLHRMLSCEVKGLPEGGTARGLFLTPKGKVVADFLLAVLPGRVALVAPPGARPRLRDSLSRYVVGEDVDLEDASGTAGLLSLVGPRAAAAAARLGPEPGKVDLLRRSRAGLPAVDILAGAGALPRLREEALAAAAAEGGGPIGGEALEALRIENGVPALGAEATEDTLPQECGLADHVSFAKGCFLGQEPVARLQNRGHTNRGLVGILLEPGAPVPERGTVILAGEKESGAVTSACLSPSLGRPVALGLLRREHDAEGTRLGLRTAAGVVSCAVASLPFVR